MLNRRFYFPHKVLKIFELRKYFIKLLFQNTGIAIVLDKFFNIRKSHRNKWRNRCFFARFRYHFRKCLEKLSYLMSVPKALLITTMKCVSGRRSATNARWLCNRFTTLANSAAGLVG